MRTSSATVPQRPVPPSSPLTPPAGASADRHDARRGVPLSDRLVRVLLADDYALFRAGLHLLLRRLPDVQVVGEATTAPEALALVDRLAPDVLVFDPAMRDVDGPELTRTLVSRARPSHILVLSVRDELERVLPVLQAGARGYLSKKAAEHDLGDAIRLVAAGELYVPARIARLLAAYDAARERPVTREPDAMEGLSERERTVFQLTAQGFAGTEIGRQLGISHKTVDTYKQRIEEKLGLRHRTEYVRYALQVGLLRG